MKKTLKALMKLFQWKLKFGKVYLAAGEHCLEVPLNFEPSSVWLKTDEGDVPACGGDISLTAATLKGSGFVIHSRVNSDQAVIHFLALGSKA
jgi:hypothetical protein